MARMFVLPDIEEYEIVRSIDYLYEGGFIKLRNIETGRSAALADTPFKYLSAKLTAEGVRVLVGKKTDECINL